MKFPSSTVDNITHTCRDYETVRKYIYMHLKRVGLASNWEPCEAECEDQGFLEVNQQINRYRPLYGGWSIIMLKMKKEKEHLSLFLL